MRYAVIGLGLLLTGCTTQIAGNEGGGMLEWDGGSQVTAFRRIEAHCAKYGRRARVTSTMPNNAMGMGSIVFVCERG